MNLYQGEFVVMPNHFHAIIGIGENRYNTNCFDAMHGVNGDGGGDGGGNDGGGDVCRNDDCRGDDCRGDDCRDAMHGVPTIIAIPPTEIANPPTNIANSPAIITNPIAIINGGAMHGAHTNPTNQFGPQSKNLASIVRGFKSSVTKAAKKIDPTFQWQSRYHEQIIRDEISFQQITHYIIQNPANWDDDEFNK